MFDLENSNLLLNIRVIEIKRRWIIIIRDKNIKVTPLKSWIRRLNVITLIREWILKIISIWVISKNFRIKLRINVTST